MTTQVDGATFAQLRAMAAAQKDAQANPSNPIGTPARPGGYDIPGATFAQLRQAQAGMPAPRPQPQPGSPLAYQMQQRRQIGQFRQDPRRQAAVRQFIGGGALRPIAPQPMFPARPPSYQWRPQISGANYADQIKNPTTVPQPLQPYRPGA